MPGKENIDITEFFDDNLNQENQPFFYERADSLTDLPASKRVLATAHLPDHGLNKKKTYLTLTDLMIPSPETPNTARCNEVVEDIKKYLANKIWDIKEYLTSKHLVSFDKLSNKDLEQRLKFIKIPIPPAFLDGLRDLNLGEWDLIIENIPEALYSAITAYMENPVAYEKNREIDIKKRQIDIAYLSREKERGT